ncbi:MAG TPA: hypothetical protein VER09_14475, partial [Pseudomonas sp.]|nr:hypothetical protein [Pseudomonas sp.]
MASRKKDSSLTNDPAPLSIPTVTTDQKDYAPGSTATFTASGLAPGSTVEFHVEHAIGTGADGVWGTPDDVLATDTGAGHESWSVTDGGPGDLDGQVNGSVTTSWYVNPDDSAGATFLLTATSAGADGVVGTADDAVATTSFTDSDPVTATGVTVTLDETAGLQNSSLPLGSPAGDLDDNDILVESLPAAFSNRLSGPGQLGAGTPLRAALSGYTGAAGNTGSNAFTLSPASGAIITDVRFTLAPNDNDSGLKTLDGTSILLYVDTT